MGAELGALTSEGPMTATCQTGAANLSIKAIEDAINAWRNRQPTPSTGDRVAAKREAMPY